MRRRNEEEVIVQCPETVELILHTATIDWLNKQFNPDYETDVLNADMNQL
jgi:hypothetical protein